MAEQPIYVTYSEELRRAIASKDVDMAALVRDELAKEGIQATVEDAPDPTSTNEERDVFLLILAGAAAASVVGSAVARVIDAITQRERSKMQEQILEVALDGRGQPVRDRHGNPVYNINSKPASSPKPGKEHTGFTAGKLLKFDFSRS